MTTLALKTSIGDDPSSKKGESVVETTLKLFDHYCTAKTSDQKRVSFSGASNSYALKHEDKHAVVFNFENLGIQKDSELRLLGFAGVFDGHDGDAASTYCSEGLLSHILAETMNLQRKKTSHNEGYGTRDTEAFLKAGYTCAFEKAHQRFSARKPAPPLGVVGKGNFGSTRVGFFGRLLGGTIPKQGGTTALVASIYMEGETPFLFVANTGDCRLLIDDGCGASDFRQITDDHRPTLSYETARLRRAEIKGECCLKHSQDTASSLRIYPGGLAVSRTIGDNLHSKAVICTPEVYKIDLNESKTYRMVLASDGLWDALSNDRVAQFASRSQLNEKTLVEEEISAEEATNRIMKECLTQGGFVDDVTVIVLDVLIDGKSRP